MSTQMVLWIAAAVVLVLYLLKRRARLRSED
jgi:hypothetical protein